MDYKKIDQNDRGRQSRVNTCKHIKDQFRANKNLLEDVFESIQDGITVLDKGLNIKRVNSFINKWYAKHSPLEGNKCYAVYHNRTEPCEFCPTLRCFQSGKTEKEIILGPDNSDTKWIELYSFPIKDRYTGSITGAVEFLRDITERIEKERVISDSEKQYRDLFDNANEMIQCVDSEGRFLRVNRKWKEALGYDNSDIATLSVWDIIHPDEITHCQEAFKNIFSGKKAGVIETKFKTKGGLTIPVEGTANCSFSDGEALSTLAIFRDISKKKLAEKEKANLKSQMIRVQKLEALGTLAGGIAHDFNNLLMTIQGNTSLMLFDMEDSHPFSETLNNIEKSVQSGAKLTKQLLGYARKGKYDVKSISLNQIIKETSEAFIRTRREISVQSELYKRLHLIDADQGQIEQILLNLFVNASDAMPGGGDLIVKTKNVTDKDMGGKLYSPKVGKYVLLTVTDNGIGMNKNTKDRIFDPFFTTKEMGRGTGLGLASVYGIVKSHGGYIDVESEKGQGTSILIFLPASNNAHQEQLVKPKNVIKGRGTILLVDDENMVLETGAAIIKRLGYRVFKAKDGPDAIGIFEENKKNIDLVILDMIMPKMGGGDTYDRMKKIDNKVKVLLSSGYSIEGQATDILQRGCDGFIQKPFSLADLSSKISEIMTVQ